MLDVLGKGEAHTTMETVSLVTRVKGAKQSKSVVKERVAVMDMGDKDYMTYHLGQ